MTNSDFEVRCCHGVTVVCPGDRLLIAAPGLLESEDLERFTKDLAQRIPGVNFTVLGGVEGFAVQRPGDQGEES